MTNGLTIAIGAAMAVSAIVLGRRVPSDRRALRLIAIAFMCLGIALAVVGAFDLLSGQNSN